MDDRARARAFLRLSVISGRPPQELRRMLSAEHLNELLEFLESPSPEDNVALFDSVCVAVTSAAAVQVFAGVAREPTQYVLLTAHPDNTAPIYVSASSGVSNDKTNAAAGDPIAAGASKAIPANKFVDGTTSKDLYAKAESGTQYLYGEVH